MQKEIYDILAALAADQPAEATSKFKEILQQRVDAATKAHIENIQIVRQREENPEIPPADDLKPEILDRDQLGVTVTPEQQAEAEEAARAQEERETEHGIA